MKEGWKKTTVGEAFTTATGNTPPKNNADFYGQFIPLVKPPELCDASLDSAEDGLSESGAKVARTLPPNSILVSCIGNLGKIGLNAVPVAFNQQINAILPDVKKALPEFMFYQVLSCSFKDQLEALASGTTVPIVNKSKFNSVAIVLPPLPEQQRIVSILEEAIDGIATAKANAEKNLLNARALFDSHLQSVFTQRGGGWVERSVGELVSEGVLVKPFDGNHGEIHPTKSDYTELGIPFIMASDLQDGSVDIENCKFISRKQADTLRVGFAKDGDVLVSHKGTIGRSAIVKTNDDYIMLTPQVTSYRIKDHNQLFNRFVRFYFMSPCFQSEMIAGAEGGATRAYMGITKQLTLKFRFPKLSEQYKITEILDVLDSETQRLESIYQQKLSALDSLKKSLLDQAFTGRL